MECQQKWNEREKKKKKKREEKGRKGHEKVGGCRSRPTMLSKLCGPSREKLERKINRGREKEMEREEAGGCHGLRTAKIHPANTTCMK